MGVAFGRKYATGTGADVYVPIVKRAVVDFAVGADWTPTAGDVKISIDGGVTANIGTLPTAIAMGNTAQWKFVFTNAELTGKTITVTVSDSATKVVEDQFFIIETYGHASAMIPIDFSDIALAAKLAAADVVVDKTTTPLQWQLVFYESGTLTELLRKDLKDVDGVAVTATTTVIGQAT